MNKISLFLPDLSGGGAQRMLVHLANEFSRKDMSVDLVLAEKSGPYLSLVSPEVNLVDLKIKFSDPRVILKLVSYIRESRPAAMLSAMTYPNVAAVLAKKLARHDMRLVLSERNTLTVQSELSKKY